MLVVHPTVMFASKNANKKTYNLITNKAFMLMILMLHCSSWLLVILDLLAHVTICHDGVFSDHSLVPAIGPLSLSLCVKENKVNSAQVSKAVLLDEAHIC